MSGFNETFQPGSGGPKVRSLPGVRRITKTNPHLGLN